MKITSLSFLVSALFSMAAAVAIGDVNFHGLGVATREGKIGPLTAGVAAMPDSTPEDLRHKASLEIALEQAQHHIRQGNHDHAAALLEDVEKSLAADSDEIGRFVSPESGIGFAPAIAVWEGNPYLEALYHWIENDLTKPDVEFVIGEVPFTGVGTQPYSGREVAARAMRYYWLVAHPQSKYHGNPEVLRRLMRRLHAYLYHYASSNPELRVFRHSWENPFDSLNDFFAIDLAVYTANAFSETFPNLVLPSQRHYWDSAFERAMRVWLDTCAEANEGTYPIGNYCNRDLGVANILLNVGLYRGDEKLLDMARSIVDAQAVNLYPDGGFAYIGAQNECGGYFNANTTFLARFYAVSGYEKCLDLLRGTRNYPILTVEPGNFTEYYTVPSWKTMWNASYGYGGEPVASLTGCPYLRGIIDQRHRYGQIEPDPLSASWYRDDMDSKPLPDGYLVLDRNIQGPRARFGRFSYAFNGRSYWENEVGKLTMVGAMIGDPVDQRRFPLNSAVKAVYPKIHVSNQTGDEWRDWAYTSRHEKNAVSVARTVAALTTRYALATQRYGPSIADEVPWISDQQWIGLPGRMVGAVSVDVDAAHFQSPAFEVNGRIRLGYGRVGPLRPKTLQEADGVNYAYGDLRVRIHQHNFASIEMAESGILRDDARRATEIILRDAREGETRGKTGKVYSTGSPLFFVVEIRPAWEDAAEEISYNREGELRVLRIREKRRTVILVHNPGANAAVYHLDGNVHGMPDFPHAAIMPSGTASALEPVQASALAARRLEVPPREHLVLVFSDAAEDIKAAPESMDEILREK